MILDTLGVLVALFIVLGLAWISLRFLARMQPGAAGPGGAPAPLRYLRAMPVGARERVVVVAYHGEELLLGVTAGGVTLLDRRPLSPAAAEPPPTMASDAARLRSAVGRFLDGRERK